MVRKIIAFRTDRIGEFILTTPAIKALKEYYPGSHLTVVVNNNTIDIANSLNYIDETLTLTSDHLNLPNIIRLSNTFRKKSFDLAVVFNPHKLIHLLVFLSKIPIRVGYNRKWPFLLNKTMQDNKHLGKTHEVSYNLNLLKTLKIEDCCDTLELPVKSNDESFINQIFFDNHISSNETVIAIHPWSSNPEKLWPIENFIDLIKEITKLQYKIVIIGGDIEKEKAEQLFSGNNDIINLTGKLSINQSAALIKRVKCLISCDSGPVHIASAVKTPVIVLFRNKPPGVSSTRWGPWRVNNTIIEADKISDISVAKVFDALKQQLNQ